MKNIFIILLAVFISACAGTKHLVDHNGNRIASFHTTKASDLIDYAHGLTATDIYERNEYGVSTDKIVKTEIKPFVVEPFLARFLRAFFVGAGGHAINAVTLGMRDKRRSGININNNPQVSTNANSDSEAGSVSDASALANSVTDVDTVFNSSHVTDVETSFDSSVDMNMENHMSADPIQSMGEW